MAAGIKSSGKYLKCNATALSRLIKLPFFINKNYNNKIIPITGPGTKSSKNLAIHSPKNWKNNKTIIPFNI